MPKIIKKHGKTALVFGLIFVLVAMYLLVPLAKAATYITNYSDALTDSRPSPVAADHTITFDVTSTVHVGDTITITFDSGFDTSTIEGTETADVDVKDESTDLTLAANCAGSEDASIVMASDVLTITICSEYAAGIAGGNTVEIQIGTNAGGTHQIVNPTVGVKDIAVAGTFGDTGTIKVAIVLGISITATVAESLSFTIEEPTLNFGTIDGANIRYTNTTTGTNTEPTNGEPCVLTLVTNASGGATITIQDLYTGLYDSGASYTIDATHPNDVSGTSESYAPYAKNNAANLAIDAAFATDGNTVTVTTTPQSFITAAGPLSTLNTVDILAKAGAAAATPTGSYADTLILVATPTF